MYTPSTYPSYVYYFDGSMFVVHKPEDLQPGCSGSPSGPFPEMSQGWKWQIWPEEGMHGGPYAHDKTKYRYERGIPLEALVYTEKHQVVDGVQRHTYEVWRRGSPEVERGIREGVFYVVPPGALLATSAKNGRCFLGDEARDAYDRRYDERDLAGFERDAPSLPDPASTAEPVRPIHNSKRHASKGGRHPIPQRDLDRFQKDLRDLVYQHIDIYGYDEPLTETMVLQRWKGKMTEAMLALRLKRTGEHWHCKGWREIFLYIVETRT